MGKIDTASGNAKDTAVVTADNERLRQELVQISKKSVPVEDRKLDGAEDCIVIFGK